LSLQRDLHNWQQVRMAEIRPIGDLAHELESLYEGLVDRHTIFSQPLASLLYQSHDQLAKLLEQLVMSVHTEQLIEAIRNFAKVAGKRLLSAAIPSPSPSPPKLC
jgi:chemosensory pili system protein ChpA (sensor histidine kinase/response regulator)